jgi:hypothetical protein
MGTRPTVIVGHPIDTPLNPLAACFSAADSMEQAIDMESHEPTSRLDSPEANPTTPTEAAQAEWSAAQRGTTDQVTGTETPPTEETVSEETLSEETVAASQPYVGQWNQLVSTTNWEKGRIVHEWREALVDSESPATEYSDEAWARLVGGVTGQHVGRLRRVFARFGETHDRFESLYWSHFQAALDWDDAELWLEGAVQSKWSVSQMRRTRWEANDAPADLKPRDEDIISTELDEDFEPAKNSDPDSLSVTSQYDQINAPPTPEGPDFGDEDSTFQADGTYADDDHDSLEVTAEAPTSRPFAEIGRLPDDVADAFEAFKLSIIRHKNAGWKDLTQAEMLGVLDSLKELAMAPGVESSAPF